jgi:Fe-S oxidoreductase
VHAPTERQILFHPARYKNDLAIRLKRSTRGEVLFDAAARARYAGDAGGHRAEPLGVFLPRDEDDVRTALAICRELGVPLVVRGAGSSRDGQAVGQALIVDTSKYLHRILAFDAEARLVTVQPGLPLERLNAFLRLHGLRFPVEPADALQATLGGMAANDAGDGDAGSMRQHVLGIDFILADGTEEFFGPFGADAERPMGSARSGALVSRLFELGAVGGPDPNLAQVLVGSRGRLAFFRRLHLKLVPLKWARFKPAKTVARPSDAVREETIARLKPWFDPDGLLNPVPPAVAQSAVVAVAAAAGGDALAMAQACDNNGVCRQFDPGLMCPSFRVTRDERDAPRGRANTVRWALAPGGPGLADPAVAEAMDLCVGCKGCRSECPQSVDVAALKRQALQAARAARGLTLRERLIAYLPRYAPWGARWPGLFNARDRVPGLARWMEKRIGISAARPLPRWRRDHFLRRPPASVADPDLVLFVDTFNDRFEPENPQAALAVLRAAGYRVHVARPAADDAVRRPLCCGRTFLAQGLVEDAAREARRMLAALVPYAARGIPIVGLEPACLLALRDEYAAMALGPDAATLAAQAFLWEEWLVRERAAGRAVLPLRPLPQKQALLHGHCHQKAFGTIGAVESILRWIPELEVRTVQASCCGMAGHFGYEAEHDAISRQMGELALLPAVREAGEGTLIVADGTSCRTQIRDGAERTAWHVARVLERALAGAA